MEIGTIFEHIAMNAHHRISLSALIQDQNIDIKKAFISKNLNLLTEIINSDPQPNRTTVVAIK